MADYKANGSEQPKPSKIKAHFRRFWWLHLISFCIGTLVITLILVFVALPAIAQHDIDRATMTVTQQVISNPDPKLVQLKMVTNSHNPSLFVPDLDSFKASLFLENTLPSIKPFGYITIPKLHAKKDATIIVEQALQIVDMEQFIAYNKLVTQNETFRVGVRGRTNLHLGALPTVSVNFNKVIEMKGLNSLKGFKVEDMAISLVPAADGSNMNGTLIVPNPSAMTITLGDVVQDLYVEGQLIGNTTIANMTLVPGDNRIPMKSISNQTLVINLVSTKYTSGILPIEARTSSITYKGQHLEYFEQAMKATPLHTDLNLGPALKVLGIDVSIFNKPSSSPSSSSSSSSSSSPSSSPSTS